MRKDWSCWWTDCGILSPSRKCCLWTVIWKTFALIIRCSSAAAVSYSAAKPANAKHCTAILPERQQVFYRFFYCYFQFLIEVKLTLFRLVSLYDSERPTRWRHRLNSRTPWTLPKTSQRTDRTRRWVHAATSCDPTVRFPTDRWRPMTSSPWRQNCRRRSRIREVSANRAISWRPAWHAISYW